MNYKRVRKAIAEEKKAMINNIFTLFDENDDGFLDYEELKAALKALGFPTKKMEVIHILKTYDRKSSKFINFDDFKTVVIDKIMKQDPIEEIKYAFKLICGENQNVIRFQELKKVVHLINLDISHNDIQSMIDDFDTNGDGAIDEDEFLRIMLTDDESEPIVMSSSGYAREDEARHTVLESHVTLGRIQQSLANSHRIAVETEEIGTEVVSELEQQRETLLRSKHRLENTSDVLDQSRSVLRKMTWNVITNKLLLILIIMLEVGILSCTVYLKFFK